MIPLTKYSKLGYQPTITLFSDIADMTPVVIPLPEPPNLNRIHNRNKPTSEQYFQRIELSQKQWNGMNEKEQQWIAWNEWEKRLNGFWFMNNGKLQWITGTHYLYIQWWRLSFGYPAFWVTDAELFQHWLFRKNDPTSYGIICIEARQTGKSGKLGVISYDEASKAPGKWSAMQSRTDTAAKELFERKIIYPWRYLLDFFRPVYDTSSSQKNELRLFAPVIRGKESLQTNQSEISELGSWMNYAPAVETAYDSATPDFYADDEFAKIEEKTAVNPKNRWGKVKPGLFDVAKKRIRGKSMHTSTVEKMNSAFGGKIGKVMWIESHHKTINELGQTTSGLHQHFTPAFRLMGQDKYGYCDEKANREYIAAMRKNQDGESLGEIIRKYPNTVKECFTISGTKCPFDTKILDFIINKYSLGNEDVAYLNFSWENGVRNSKVIFTKSENQKEFSQTGRWCASYLFDNPTLSNAQIMKNGKKCPANTENFGAGADPFKYDTDAIKNHDKESLGGGLVGRKLNSSVDSPKDAPYEWIIEEGTGNRILKINHITNRTCCEYLYRPSTVEEYCEDMLMMCVYYGCKIFPEKNVDVIERYFKARGYEKYLFFEYNEKKGVMEQSAGDTTDAALIQELIAVLATYIIENGYREVHHEWAIQAREFNGKFNDYDLLMSKGYQLLGEKRKTVALKINNPDDKPENWFTPNRF